MCVNGSVATIITPNELHLSWEDRISDIGTRCAELFCWASV